MARTERTGGAGEVSGERAGAGALVMSDKIDGAAEKARAQRSAVKRVSHGHGDARLERDGNAEADENRR
jgi:hypothetical protein